VILLCTPTDTTISPKAEVTLGNTNFDPGLDIRTNLTNKTSQPLAKTFLLAGDILVGDTTALISPAVVVHDHHPLVISTFVQNIGYASRGEVKVTAWPAAISDFLIARVFPTAGWTRA
tara:strand:- start:105 stop:458 length:354 start_codon:yes stop_codon:yes gene_type:complete